MCQNYENLHIEVFRHDELKAAWCQIEKWSEIGQNIVRFKMAAISCNSFTDIAIVKVRYCQMVGEGGGMVNHRAQRIKAFISKSSRGNSVAASSVLVLRVTVFIN